MIKHAAERKEHVSSFCTWLNRLSKRWINRGRGMRATVLSLSFILKLFDPIYPYNVYHFLRRHYRSSVQTWIVRSNHNEEWRKKGSSPNKNTHLIRPAESMPAHIYGFLKIHEKNHPMRTVMSAIKWVWWNEWLNSKEENMFFPSARVSPPRIRIHVCKDASFKSYM
jgi:hypothetical protein